MKKRTSRSKMRSNRVAAWIYTVLNPVVLRLCREQELLKERNLTWGSGSRRCELIRTVKEYVEVRQWPNYDDFVADNAPLSKRFEEHDNALSFLERCALDCFDGLTRDHRMRPTLQAALQEYEAGINAGQPGQYSLKQDERLGEWIAEYLINDRHTLPTHYTPHAFWTRFGNRFRPLREVPAFEKLARATSDLSGISSKLQRQIEDFRLGLCRKFDVPAAPLAVGETTYVNASY